MCEIDDIRYNLTKYQTNEQINRRNEWLIEGIIVYLHISMRRFDKGGCVMFVCMDDYTITVLVDDVMTDHQLQFSPQRWRCLITIIRMDPHTKHKVAAIISYPDCYHRSKEKITHSVNNSLQYLESRILRLDGRTHRHTNSTSSL